MAEDNVVDQPSAVDIAEAKELGWVEQDKFRGKPELWIDASTFLARGRDVMPLLRKNNERLRGELKQDRETIKSLQEQVAAGAESVKELLEFHKEQIAEKKKEARAELLAEIKAAREAGDVEAETTALGELSAHDAENAASTRKGANGAGGQPDPKPAPKDAGEGAAPRVEPWFTDWLEENPWAKENSRKTRMANVIAGEMRADPQYKDLKGAAFLDKVAEMTDRELGGGGDSRVDSGGNRFPSGGGNGRTFNDLPAEAKAKAREQTRKFVGEGKPFKSEKEWFSHYAETFFA